MERILIGSGPHPVRRLRALEGAAGVQVLEQVALVRLVPADLRRGDRPEVEAVDERRGQQAARRADRSVMRGDDQASGPSTSRHLVGLPPRRRSRTGTGTRGWPADDRRCRSARWSAAGTCAALAGHEPRPLALRRGHVARAALRERLIDRGRDALGHPRIGERRELRRLRPRPARGPIAARRSASASAMRSRVLGRPRRPRRSRTSGRRSRRSTPTITSRYRSQSQRRRGRARPCCSRGRGPRPAGRPASARSTPTSPNTIPRPQRRRISPPPAWSVG